MKIFEKIKDFFIPHQRNNYAPASLQKYAVLGMMLLVLISFATANLQALLWISSEWMVSTILPAVIVQETNAERQADNLIALKRNKTLDEAAQLKADDMASKSYFSHNSPGGETPWYWFTKANYKYVHAGENLAVHFTDSSEVVEAWMKSPSHRANIMNGNYQEIGIGTAKGTYEGFDTVFVVQLFGTPEAVVAPVVAIAPTPVPVPEAVIETNTVPAVAEIPAVTTPVVEPVVELESNNSPVVAGVNEAESDFFETTTQEVPSSTPITLATVEETKVEEEVDFTDQGTVVYSSFTSTSTGGVPATVEPASNVTGGTTSAILSIATKPHKVLQISYMIIGGFVLLLLIISILVEIRKQHPIQIAYGAGLVALMFVLFNVHLILSQGVLIM